MICTINVQRCYNVCCHRQIYEEIYANLSLKSPFLSFLSLNSTWKVGLPFSFWKSLPPFWFPNPKFFFSPSLILVPSSEGGGVHYARWDLKVPWIMKYCFNLLYFMILCLNGFTSNITKVKKKQRGTVFFSNF